MAGVSKEREKSLCKQTMSEILPNLWLGPLGITYDKDFLKENNIRRVVTVFEECHRTAVLVDLKIESMYIQLYDKDDSPIGDSFTRAVAFIDEALQKGEGVYVHCFAGVSRSPTIVAAYLIWSRNMTAQNALDHIFERRPIIDPNDGFRQALFEWESKCKNE